MTDGRIIARRRFSEAAQEAFAAFSGDRNPIHVDMLAARRSLPGQRIVHGMHTLIWALEVLQREEGRTAKEIRARFLKPIFLDEEVNCLWDEARALLTVTDGEVMLATIQLSGSPVTPTGMLPVAPMKPAPDAPDFAECKTMRDCPWRFHGDPTRAEAMFPAFVDAYSAALACEIGALSHIVGMECPGLRSLFSALSLEIAPSEGPPRYGVTMSDDRFRLLQIAAQGPAASAEIEAFHTPPAPPQRTIEEISAVVAPAEFVGVTALIVGGSRGLGAVVARLIAAGGGTPIITYDVGADEASSLREEIRAAGRVCKIRQLTVGPDTTIPSDIPAIDQMYFFATPRISTKRSRAFQPDLAASFEDIYVRGFARLSNWLSGQQRRASVLFPSTAFIEEPPPGFAEYVAAKKAGEALCKRLNASGSLIVLYPRLPRLATDQTLSLQGIETGDPVAAMLPLVRRMTSSASAVPKRWSPTRP